MKQFAFQLVLFVFGAFCGALAIILTAEPQQDPQQKISLFRPPMIMHPDSGA